MYVTPPPNKGASRRQQNRAQKRATRSCIVSVLKSKDSQLILEMYRICRACHVFQQGLSEVHEAWLNSTCKTV